MPVHITAHARQRMTERGASEAEVITTITDGIQQPAKQQRSCFIYEFYESVSWQGKVYKGKRLEVLAIQENETWFIISVIVKYIP